MNTRTPKSSSKSNKRKRPSTSRWSSKAKRRKSTQQEHTAPDAEKWYIIKDIIDEKVEEGQLRYLFDWENDAETGESYEPSWELAELANEEAVAAWKQSVRYFELHPEERPVWREQEDDLSHSGYCPDNSASSQYSSIGENQGSQGVLIKDQSPGKPQVARESQNGTLTATFEQLRAGRRFLELESEDFSQPPSSDPSSHLGALVTEGAEAQIADNLVVLLPQKPSLDPLDYRRIQLSQDSSNSTPVFQRVDHPARRLIDQSRVIPDSQEVSEATNSGPQDDLAPEAASQGLEPGTASQLSNRSVTDEIPSHQPEPGLSTGRQGQVNSEFIIFHQDSTIQSGTIDTQFGTSGHSASHSSRGPETSDKEPDYLTQLPFDSGILPPTSSAASTHALQQPNVDLAQHRLDSESQATGDTSLQAAQIVPPFVSRSEYFSSQIDSRTSDHHGIEDIVPETASRPVSKAPNTQDSQVSRQALSELDVNTRSSSSVPSSQVLSGSFGDKYRTDLVADIEANQATPRHSSQSYNSNISRPAVKVSQQVHSSAQEVYLQMNMESAPPSNTKPLSARERLRLLQEQAFAEIESDGHALQSSDQKSPAISNSVARGPHAPPETESDGPPPSTVKDSVTIQGEAPEEVTRHVEQPADAATRSGLVPSVESEHHAEVVSRPLTSDYTLPHHEAGVLGEAALRSPEDAASATLDPAALSLSIEQDIAASPSIPTDDGIPSVPVAQDSIESPGELAKPLEQVETQNSSGTVLSYILTAASEYLITLPLANNIREQYNQVLRQYGESLASYNAAFTTTPHQKVHPALVSKVDAMFHQLFDMCDLPPFLETLPSMRPEYVTKHVRGTNCKFAFILEFLEHLRKLGSEKKVLILARPGQIVTLLDTAIKTEGYSNENPTASTTVTSSDAQQPLTAMVASTADDLSLLPRDFDVVIAYDHTFQQKILPPRGDGGNRMTMVLVTTASIEHINLRISDRADPLERRNILISALCSSAARGAIEYPGIGFQEPHKIAELFAKYLELPDNDDFYWTPQELPDGTFDDVFPSSQVDQTQTPSAANGVLEHEKARKRSHDSDEERLSKRPRMTHPPMGPKETQMSDALRKLLGRRTSPDKPTKEVSVEKLEAVATKFANMELELERACSQRDQFRALSDRTKSELDSWVRTVNKLQRKFMTALEDRGSFDAQAKAAQRQAQEVLAKLEKNEAQKIKIEEENKDLKSKLAEATQTLLNSPNPDIAKMALLQKERDEAIAKLSGLEKKAETTQNELDFIRDRYQQQSTGAKDLLEDKSNLERRIEELSRKADDNIVKVNEIQARSEAKALKAMLDEQKTIVIEREVELNRCRDELRSLKSNRRETRQTSVPRSPRLSSLGVMSPRHANNHHARERNAGVTASSSVSRNTSPGPTGAPPTGVFEGGHFFGVGGQTGNSGRYSHLRD